MMAKSSKVRCTELENRMTAVKDWTRGLSARAGDLSQLVTLDSIKERDDRIKLLESRLQEIEEIFLSPIGEGDPDAEADEGPLRAFEERMKKIEALEFQLTKRLNVLEGRSPNRAGDFQQTLEELLERADLRVINEH